MTLFQNILFILLSASLFSANATEILVETNDAGEAVWINPSKIDDPSNFKPQSFFNFKKPFSKVTNVLNAEVENAFDLFVFANVAPHKKDQDYSGHYIPPQRMRIFRKKHAGQRIFNRNFLGKIDPDSPVNQGALGVSDHHPAIAGIPAEILISSGAGHLGSDYVDTFSGVFRINTQKSLTRRFQDGMIHSVYVDIKYPWGKMSGIAIHGTFKSRYKYLGGQASHGCIRVKQEVALPFYEYVLSEPLYDPNLLDFDNTQKLPEGPLRDPRPGQRVLFVFFYGY